MPLKAGTTLGNYDILAQIGAGGMGEVYRARDNRLARDVAVKILPEAFARDPERMRRFELEARAVAALNHPNVLSVFDAGMQDGVPYLVSELLEGESLRQVLTRGPIASRKAVEYARQIADGLAAAHEKKIVHRDLKPENIFLTAAGRVKILDFGLAKMTVMEGAVSPADGATATIGIATGSGVVMGTTGYLAPEQVRGETADHRADIFSFGATLYEMLSGQRAFLEETSIETLSAILRQDPPDLDTEKLHVAPGLERIVRHCLEKKPAERFQSASDLMFALGALSETAITAQGRAFVAPRRSKKTAAALALAALLGAGVAYWAVQRQGSSERTEFAIAVPGEVSHLAISPDGTWLAFTSPGETDGSPMVFVQRIGSSGARAIPETEGASYPFWSPDDAYVAFFAKGKLRKVAIAGGAPQNLTAVSSAPRGGSWGRKGILLFAPDSHGALWRVNADGSGATPVTEKWRNASQTSHRWPSFLPDGDHFLMFAGNFSQTDDQANAIYLCSLSRSEKSVLLPARSSAAYADNRVYYVDANGALAAAPLDVSSGKIVGTPQVIASKAARSPSTYYAALAVSENSTVVYSGASTTNHSQLTWFDGTGKEIGRVGPVSVMANPALSPDGRQVAFDSNDFKANNVDLWILDLVSSGGSRFTFDPTEEVAPAWSRDGSTIAYRSLRNAAPTVQLKKANGLQPGNNLTTVGDAGLEIVPSSWSPDDREILCTFQTSSGTTGLVLVPVDGSKARPFLVGPANQTNAQISPDGKWVAYASDEGGDWEVYVTTFPGANGKWQVSHGGGREPRWRGDGKAIFYIGASQTLTEVAVATQATFSTIGARSLFPIRARAPISSTDVVTYDVTRDGKRFLVNQYVKPDQAPPLNIVLHATGPAAK